MAKNKQKQKGLLESVHDGYVRGSMGGEEDTSQARIVTSPEPLPDEIKKFRKLYILVPLSLVIGLIKRGFYRMVSDCCIYIVMSCLPD